MFSTRTKALFTLVLCAFLWSTAGVGIKLISGTNLFMVLGIRALVSIVIFLAYFKFVPVYRFSNKWFNMVCISHALMVFSFVFSTSMTTAANAIMLQYSAPIFVCIYMFLIFRKPLPKSDILAVIFVFVGILIFFMESLQGSLTVTAQIGNMLAVVSGASYGLQAAAIPFLNQKDARATVIFAAIFVFLLSLPLMLLDWQLNLKDFLIICYLGFFQMGLAYILFLRTIDKVTPLELILIPTLEPLLSPIWVFIMTGEKPSLIAVIGGAVVISTIVIWNIYKSRLQEKKSVSVNLD